MDTINNLIIYSIYVIIVLVIIYFIIRTIIYNHIISFNNKGKFSNDVNLLYDDHHQYSKTLSDRKLINNLAIFRKNICCDIYESDNKNINLNNNQKYNILFIESCNCKFEKVLLEKYKNNINIVITCSNIFEVENISKNIKRDGLENNINILYVDENMNDFIEKNLNMFDRIILRENLGKFNNRIKLFENLNKLLKKDSNSFILVKTLTFAPIFTEDNKKLTPYDTYLFEKQKKLIDFWNYNFSTKQAIINDLIKSGHNNIEYNILPIYLLIFSYNIKDFLNLLEIYFIDLDLAIENIIDWIGIYTLNILTIKIYSN